MTRKNLRRRTYRNKKLSKKEKIFLSVFTVLIIVIIVALSINNGLSKVLAGLDTLLENIDHDTVPVQGDDSIDKVYTSILSGKATITLPSQFDTGTYLEVHFIDIGQGDAIAINFPDGKTMLIDSGSATSGIDSIKSEYMEYLGDITNDKVIEYMVVTHPDSDHYNMFTGVLEGYDVKSIFYNENAGSDYTDFITRAKEEPDISAYEVDSESTTFTIEGTGYKITIYACGDSAFDGASDNNAMSMICLLEFGGRKVLFTGDAVMATEEWYITKMGDTAIDIDVLKVGHHGSKTSTSTEFLDYINAEYAVISCDDGTKYGHPHEETMTSLSAFGMVTYRTNLQGNILLYIDSDGDFGFLTENSIAAQNNTNNIDEKIIAVN